MLSIGGDDLVKLTFFRYEGDDSAKLTRLQMSNFLPKIIVGILVVRKLNAKIDRGCVVACSAVTVCGNVKLRDYLQENALIRDHLILL